MKTSRRIDSTFFLLGIASILLVLLCFWTGLGGDFILDDEANIQHNDAIKIAQFDLDSLERAAFSFVARGGLRVIPELSFAIDYGLWGLDPFAFKATNLFIHALTVLALMGFFRCLLRAAGWLPRKTTLVAAGMALAWAVHPLQVSTVLYAVQRMQTLCTLFVVLTLWAWLKMRLAQINDDPSRRYGLVALLCWLLALASKEDAALFPLYALLLELTVLRFRASSSAMHKTLRLGFAGFAVAGLSAYLLWVIPHYWNWGPYPGRDFSSLERLLTEGRVLVMYLGQILWPLPSRMPFFYDDFEVSRGVLEPWTTLPSLILIAVLLALGWRLRKRRPLFAFGLLLFFAGHFMTSNVLGLELVFEHRNQLPLIGVVLALADLMALAVQRLKLREGMVYTACALAIIGLGAGTWVRASTWGNPTSFAESTVLLVPQSPRAWMVLCLRYHDLSKDDTASPYFAKALDACERGSAIQGSAAPLALLIQYKARNGTVTQADWSSYLDRLGRVPMSPENRRSAWSLMLRAMAGDRLGADNVIHAVNIVSGRFGYSAHEFITIGYFVLGNPDYADNAYQYFEQAVRNLPAGDPSVAELLRELRKQGRTEWAGRLESLRRSAAVK